MQTQSNLSQPPSGPIAQTFVVSCQYCKREGHVVDECRKLQYKREQEMKENPTSSTTERNEENNLPFRAGTKKIQITQADREKTFIEFTSDETIKRKFHLVLDTGAALLLIDIKILTQNLINQIDPSQTVVITEERIASLDQITLQIYIDGKSYLVDFQVYNTERIAIPLDGVLGMDIIGAMNATLDYTKHELFLQKLNIRLPFRYQYTIAPNCKQIISIELPAS